MSRKMWYVLIGVLLLALSALLYGLHFLIFESGHHIFIYMLGDLAFMFIEVLVVVVIIDRLLSSRERRAHMEKMNMVIGAFFSEVGTRLLAILSAADPDAATKREVLQSVAGWEPGDFLSVKERLKLMEFECAGAMADLPALKDLLTEKRAFMVELLENPLVLEHESFSDVLWAVFHLTEELDARQDLDSLPVPDLEHIAGDMGRAYGRTASQWVDYMLHLESNYPFLFSFAVRTNPFDNSATVLIGAT